MLAKEVEKLMRQRGQRRSRTRVATAKGDGQLLMEEILKTP